MPEAAVMILPDWEVHFEGEKGKKIFDEISKNHKVKVEHRPKQEKDLGSRIFVIGDDQEAVNQAEIALVKVVEEKCL